MSSQLYRYVTRGSFVLAAISVLCVDRFPDSIIPTISMIGAALISLGAYFISHSGLSLAVESDDGETSSKQDLVPQATAVHNLPQNEWVKAVVRSSEKVPLQRKLELECDLARLAQEYEAKTAMLSAAHKRRVFVSRGFPEVSHLYFEAAYSLRKPHHSPAAAAVEIATSLGSTEYDVALAPDGTIKIRRVARSQPTRVTPTTQGKQQGLFALEHFNPAYPIQ